MRVKMLVSMAGLVDREPGQIVEVSSEEAARLINAGFAEPAEGPGAPEAAVIEPPERAIMPRPAPRKPPKKAR